MAKLNKAKAIREMIQTLTTETGLVPTFDVLATRMMVTYPKETWGSGGNKTAIYKALKAASTGGGTNGTARKMGTPKGGTTGTTAIEVLPLPYAADDEAMLAVRSGVMATVRAATVLRELAGQLGWDQVEELVRLLRR